MSTKKGQIKLGAFLQNSGHHVASWRHPDVPVDSSLDFAFYKRLAQTAERAKFDMIFLADGNAVWGDRGQGSDVLKLSGKLVRFEPLTLLSALSAVTEHVGLVATASTTYNEPYHIARKFASLDYLSGGRAGWNIVTSSQDAEAKNFSRDHHMDHALRYERAREFCRSQPDYGIAGTMMPLSVTKNQVCMSILAESTCSTTRANTSRCVGRSTWPVHRKATLSWCRPGHLKMDRTSQRK